MTKLLEVRDWDNLKGPGIIPCEQRCEIPEGVELVAYPETRHAWPGFVNCQNGCGRSFEVKKLEE